VNSYKAQERSSERFEQKEVEIECGIRRQHYGAGKGRTYAPGGN